VRREDRLAMVLKMQFGERVEERLRQQQVAE
jgi:hypothetical protein